MPDWFVTFLFLPIRKHQSPLRETLTEEKQTPSSKFAGESLTWSLAKESGNYEDSLRYPSEDSQYEKLEMDKLVL